jgi:hydroxypyruvate reductase
MSSDLRARAKEIWEAALERVQPERLIQYALEAEPGVVTVHGERFTWGPSGRLRLLALGKAAAPFARAVHERLGATVADGLIVTKEGHAATTPHLPFRVLEAAHPLPDERSVIAGREVARFLAGGRPEDLVLLLLSGGASALAILPRPPLTLADLRQVTDLLLRSGATIHELSIVRKHLDRIKGGGLLALAAPARVLVLLLSDVVGDSSAVIGGGPAAADPTTFAEAQAVLAARGVWEDMPAAVRALIARGVAGLEPETLKPADPRAALAKHTMLANGTMAAEAAAARAAALGFAPVILGTAIEGEAREVARRISATVREAALHGRPAPPPVALVWAGETTVTVRGAGSGGRNQELALAAALELDGLPDVVLAAIGTDGTDGPTDAAGGVVDGETAARARALGLDLRAALARNDAYPTLAAVGGLIRTGPTRTHVNDLGIALVGGSPAQGAAASTSSSR